MDVVSQGEKKLPGKNGKSRVTGMPRHGMLSLIRGRRDE
jgi:hypothetical protein